MFTLAVLRSIPMETPDELTLLNRLDSRAVTAVFDRYFPEVFRYARYRLGDEAQAEDIASEVFVRLLEAVKARRGPGANLHGWLLATASHMIADHMRRRYRRPQEELDDNLPALLPALQDQVERNQQQQALQQALAHLTGEQQHVLSLRFGNGYSLEETAVVMKKNVNTVKQLQFRALSALQRRIGGNP